MTLRLGSCYGGAQPLRSSGPCRRKERPSRRPLLTLALQNKYQQKTTAVATSPTIMRLETTGLDSLEVFGNVAELMCDVAFENSLWDSYDDEPPEENSAKGQIDRQLYKAKFIAGISRKRYMRQLSAFDQLLVLDNPDAHAEEPSGEPGVHEVPSCTDPALCTASRILGYADISVERLRSDMAEALSLPANSSTAVLRNCIIRSEARQHGLGTALVAGCVASARKLLAQEEEPRLVLEVYRHNDPALALYTSAGFEVVEDWEDTEWLAGVEMGALWPPKKVLMVACL